MSGVKWWDTIPVGAQLIAIEPSRATATFQYGQRFVTIDLWTDEVVTDDNTPTTADLGTVTS